MPSSSSPSPLRSTVWMAFRPWPPIPTASTAARTMPVLSPMGRPHGACGQSASIPRRRLPITTLTAPSPPSAISSSPARPARTSTISGSSSSADQSLLVRRQHGLGGGKRLGQEIALVLPDRGDELLDAIGRLRQQELHGEAAVEAPDDAAEHGADNDRVAEFGRVIGRNRDAGGRDVDDEALDLLPVGEDQARMRIPRQPALSVAAVGQRFEEMLLQPVDTAGERFHFLFVEDQGGGETVAVKAKDLRLEQAQRIELESERFADLPLDRRFQHDELRRDAARPAAEDARPPVVAFFPAGEQVGAAEVADILDVTGDGACVCFGLWLHRPPGAREAAGRLSQDGKGRVNTERGYASAAPEPHRVQAALAGFFGPPILGRKMVSRPIAGRNEQTV